MYVYTFDIFFYRPYSDKTTISIAKAKTSVGKWSRNLQNYVTDYDKTWYSFH